MKKSLLFLLFIAFSFNSFSQFFVEKTTLRACYKIGSTIICVGKGQDYRSVNKIEAVELRCFAVRYSKIRIRYSAVPF
jgi:hypothetical protein